MPKTYRLKSNLWQPIHERRFYAIPKHWYVLKPGLYFGIWTLKLWTPNSVLDISGSKIWVPEFKV